MGVENMKLCVADESASMPRISAWDVFDVAVSRKLMTKNKTKRKVQPLGSHAKRPPDFYKIKDIS